MCGFVFFFKQKTAYEMRISDWSSDVCASDLSPTAKKQGSARTCLCSHAFATISGPMPAGSPRDIAKGAMLILSIPVFNFSQLQRPAEGHADRCARACSPVHPQAASGSVQMKARRHSDRESTRLNSSH